ncbi:hypothetical protein Ddc_04116 [Ditylenchus destructor]|nr:hypothetical protein Ddc_04116 [Ditylenchus destructor]
MNGHASVESRWGPVSPTPLHLKAQQPHRQQTAGKLAAACCLSPPQYYPASPGALLGSISSCGSANPIARSWCTYVKRVNKRN